MDLEEKINFAREVYEQINKLTAPKTKHCELDVALLCLRYKAEILFRNVIQLIEQNQFQSSAYLVRGIIETRADINYLLSHPDSAIDFNRSIESVRKAQIKLGQQKPFPPVDVRWCEDSIRARVKLLGELILSAYDYLCTFCHSTPMGVEIILRKEEKKCLEGQLFISTHNMIGLYGTLGENEAKSRQMLDDFAKVLQLTEMRQ